MNVRYAATLGMLEILKGNSLNLVIPMLREKGVKEKDYALLQELLFGLCRWHVKLNILLRLLLRKPLKKKDLDIEILLHVGLYQLIYLNIPPHAIVHDTVEVVNHLKKNWAKAFVNGVLREFSREKERLLIELENNEEAHLSHPQWFLDKIKKAWPQQYKEILEKNNEKPPLTLRVNERKISQEQYFALLTQENIAAKICKLSPVGIQLLLPQDVKTLPGFKEGLFSIQDEAAQLAATLLDLAPQQQILDACCAPGGKLFHLMERESQLKEVIGIDKEEKRLDSVKETMERLKLFPTVLAMDVKNFKANWSGNPFDRILADVPCSATGVLRRHPDIKLLRDEKQIKLLTETQYDILCDLWSLLAPKGILLYATCSILPEENEAILKRFLEHHDNVQVLPIILSSGLPQDVGYQLLPGVENTDGFYYAKLMKI